MTSPKSKAFLLLLLLLFFFSFVFTPQNPKASTQKSLRPNSFLSGREWAERHHSAWMADTRLARSNRLAASTSAPPNVSVIRVKSDKSLSSDQCVQRCM